MVAAARERLARRRPSNLPPPDPLRAEPKVAVMVRKRPLIARERALKAVDVVSCLDNHVVLHEPKTRVDLTRRVRSSAFTFDAAFDERVDDRDVYREAVSPLVKLCLEASGADATCFAYGQTGSGKTHTMNGCYRGVADEVCAGAERGGLAAWCSFFEVYGGKCHDLLRDRAPCQALEDARGRVRVVNLREERVKCAADLVALVRRGESVRATGRTDANATSSRSHSVLQVRLRRKPGRGEQGADGPTLARLSLIDLAGSERGADRGDRGADACTRREGAEINKSLLALKECIRALGGRAGINNAAKSTGDVANNSERASADRGPNENVPPSAASIHPDASGANGGSPHVPFRGSKLTTILRDAFVGKHSRTVLLAHVSPGHGSAEHTLNTLRYAIRLKDGVEGAPVAPEVDELEDEEGGSIEEEEDEEEEDSYEEEEEESSFAHAGNRTSRRYRTTKSAYADDGFLVEPKSGLVDDRFETGPIRDAVSEPPRTTPAKKPPAPPKRTPAKTRPKTPAKAPPGVASSARAAPVGGERERRVDDALGGGNNSMSREEIAAARAADAHARAALRAEAAGAEMVAAHFALADLEDESRALRERYAFLLDRASGASGASGASSSPPPASGAYVVPPPDDRLARLAAYDEFREALEGISARREALDRAARDAVSVAKATRDEEERAARDAEAAAWGNHPDPWDPRRGVSE